MTKDSQTAQYFLKKVWSEEIALSDDFNWLGLAQVASQKATAFEASDHQEAKLRWAKIAIRIKLRPT